MLTGNKGQQPRQHKKSATNDLSIITSMNYKRLNWRFYCQKYHISYSHQYVVELTTS